MKRSRISLLIVAVLLIVPLIVSAGDFDWTKDSNLRAEADPSGLRARLEARFHVGDMTIKTVLDNVEKPADAYVLLRLGEMSGRAMDQVIGTYKVEKSRGWGVLAQSLGIKPGSKDFRALKQGQDLYDDGKGDGDRLTGKGKGRSRK